MQTLTEVVSRAICSSRGHDPELMVVSGTPYIIDGKQFANVSAFHEPVALWRLYQIEAIAAINALAAYIAVPAVAPSEPHISSNL